MKFKFGFLVGMAFAMQANLIGQQWLGNNNPTDPIYRGGSVGIGTTTFPTDRLQVSGGNIMLDNASAGSNGNLFFGGKTDLMQNGMRLFFLPTGVVAGGFIDVRTTNATEGLKFRVDNINGGVERMRITAQGRVGIGTAAPNYLLEVNGNGRFATSLVVNNNALTSASLSSYSPSGFPLATWAPSVSSGGAYLQGLRTGVYGIAGTHTAGGPNPFEAIGVWGIGGPLGTNKGVGVHGDGQGTFYSVGVWGQSMTGSIRYGVWGDANPFFGYAGYFSGDVYATGSYLPSDQNLKSNIREIDGAIEILSQLNSYSYLYKTEEFPTLNLPGKTQYGFLSQEVEKVLPELIKTTVQPDKFDSDGNLEVPSVEFKAINYIAMIPLLVQGLKEQQDQIEELRNEIRRLKDNDQLEITLEQSPRLEQNAPNPFSQSTTIRYFIPNKIANASIHITNLNGVELKAVQLSQRGEGRLVIQAGELQAGTYVYYLNVDGKIVSSYKMILTE